MNIYEPGVFFVLVLLHKLLEGFKTDWHLQILVAQSYDRQPNMSNHWTLHGCCQVSSPDGSFTFGGALWEKKTCSFSQLRFAIWRHHESTRGVRVESLRCFEFEIEFLGSWISRFVFVFFPDLLARLVWGFGLELFLQMFVANERCQLLILKGPRRYEQSFASTCAKHRCSEQKFQFSANQGHSYKHL